MSSSRIVVKDLLVTKRLRGVRKNGPKAIQVPESPLLTNFEKWSDKKRKLYFADEKSMISRGLENFNLDHNVFASLLASPMRCERTSRQKVPKDFLTQLKLKNLPHKVGKHSLQLGVSNADVKGGKTSYVLNSNELLKKNAKSATSWIPIPALMSNMRYFNVSDVLVDKENMAKDCVIELRRCFEREIVRLPKNQKNVQLENWDIVVRFESKSEKPFELINCDSLKVIAFNLGYLDAESWVSKAVHSHRNHELGLVLKLPRDSELVKHVYRLWAFF